MAEWFDRYRPGIETCLAALIGIVIFNLLRMPAATLSGAMVGVAVLLCLGRKTSLNTYVSEFGMLLGGIAMGCSVTPEMLQGFQKYPISLAIFVVSIGATLLLTQFFFRRFAGWDRATAFFAAAPGALTAVLSVAADTRADLLKVTMAQSLRLFLLVAALPSVVSATGAAGPILARGTADPYSMILMLAGGAAFSLALQYLGMAGPWIFGGMVVSAVLHAASFVQGDAPSWMVELGFAIVGIFIGTRFSLITRHLLLSTLRVSLIAFAIGLAVAAIFSSIASVAASVPFGQALVAFAPGGLEAMIILGAAMGLDPIYVGLHHLVRFFGIGLLVPFSILWLPRAADRDIVDPLTNPPKS